MKKISFIFLLFMFVFITGCGTSNETRTVTTTGTFSSVASSHNLVASSNMDTYVGYDYINDAMVASSTGIDIEMIIYDNEDTANSAQENHIESFNLLKATGASINKDKGKNFYKYEMISNGYYMISSRIDNTLIFCKTSLDNKDTVESFFEELGY